MKAQNRALASNSENTKQGLCENFHKKGNSAQDELSIKLTAREKKNLNVRKAVKSSLTKLSTAAALAGIHC